ncbi:NAD(P)/FAD-dependent oxidoreductase [Nitratireductor thuwali]|uniref:Hydrogen cyanide synthase subunit HcnC n=1 Tax=Nitratireductor thuwali TaxID=2267699 RepID=A0ABY5MNZ1_9HYPH|nr:Hydrogen cyanide synthase subunit HcnC [Nitratireductor thuwali]
MTVSSDVIVIGGGLHGCSAAFHLGSRGYKTHVLEKDYSGRHASGVNAGGVRTLGRHKAELPLAVAAKKLWANIEEIVGEDCGFRPVGGVRVAENAEEMRRLSLRSSSVARLGLEHEERLIDADELRALLPAISRACVGGLYVAGDGFANPFRTTEALRRRAIERGAAVFEGVELARLCYKQGVWHAVSECGREFQAPILINCAGAWGDRVAALVGDRVPLSANGSMMMITSRLPRIVKPVVGAAGRSLSLKQFDNGTILIGGGHRAPVNRDKNETTLNVNKLALAAQTVAELFPALRQVQILRFWSGIEGFTPDMLPIVGASKNAPSAFHAFGFSAHGFQLGPIVGQVLADLVEKGETDLPIAAFSPCRFNSKAAA